MKPESPISKAMRVMIEDRDQYQFLTEKEKESALFIVNRFMSKYYPEISCFLNLKHVPKDILLDIWYMQLKNGIFKGGNGNRNTDLIKQVPYWFWQRPKKVDNVKRSWTKMSNKDIKMILDNNPDMTEEDLEIVNEQDPESVEFELKYLQKLDKQE